MPATPDFVRAYEPGVFALASDLTQSQNSLMELTGSLMADLFAIVATTGGCNSASTPMVASMTGSGPYTLHVGGTGQSCWLRGKPVVTTFDAAQVIPTNSGSQIRIDLLCAQPVQGTANGASRPVTTVAGQPYPQLGAVTAPTIVSETEYDQTQTLAYQYVEGTPGGGVPSVPSGYTAVAQVTNPASSGVPVVAIVLPNPAALLGTQSVFNVMAYGATGNGVSDDTAALQAACNACIAAGGGQVYLPLGTYIISAPITLASVMNFGIIGCGQGSVIQSTGDFDILQIQSGSPSFVLQNLALVGFSATSAFYVTGAAIHVLSPFTSGGFRFTNISTTGCGYGLKLDQQGGGRNVIIGSVIKGNLMGIYSQHDMHIEECDVKGGTYGIVCDNTQEGFQVHTSRLFGACSFLVTNTTGTPTVGNSIKMVNCEANYSPPPQAGGGSPVAAAGSFTLSGTPTTGDSYSLLVGESGGIQSPVSVPVSETTGQTLAQSATAAATAINNSAIGPNGSNPLVTALASGNAIGITSIEMGQGGNNVTIAAVNGADVTVAASGSHLTGGADTGIWPGDSPGDPLSSLPNASILSTVDYNFAFCPHQLHLVDSWGASQIFGVAGVVGPSACTLVGGSYNASVKGKNRGTFYAIDVQQLSTQGGKGSFVMVGGVAQALAGTALSGIVHFAQGAVNATMTGVQLNNQQGNNPAIVIDDATGSCDISVSNCPMIGSNPSVSPVQFYAAIGTAVMPTVVVRNCPGLNPRGLVVAISTGAWTTGQVLTNDYGFDGYIVLAGGSSVVVSIYDQLTNSYTASLLGSGVPIPVPAQGRIKIAFSVAPTSAQFVVT